MTTVPCKKIEHCCGEEHYEMAAVLLDNKIISIPLYRRRIAKRSRPSVYTNGDNTIHLQASMIAPIPTDCNLFGNQAPSWLTLEYWILA
jgi:hypothetical protein